MKRSTHYGTVTEALDDYRRQGFTIDFNLQENCIACHLGKFEAEEFTIADLYRYEGDTDPADEATVYAIQSVSGLKGVLVTGYGISSEVSPELLKKLHG